MGFENFNFYTEVDPNTRIAVAASRVTWTALTSNEVASVYKDKGAAYFSGDFTHLLTVYCSAAALQSIPYFWVLSNATGITGGGAYLSLVFYNTVGTLSIRLAQHTDDGSVQASDAFTAGSLSTPYYLRIVRNESVGTYGTIYCYIYSDPARTTLVDTLTVTLQLGSYDFRYIFACGVTDDDNSAASSGYSEDLELFDTAGVSPAVTIQAMTSIATTTATGNGNVLGLGEPAATQHGHCWSTTPGPTTDDDKTTNGAPGATGAFTSSLTSLTEDTKYYVRAYITNADGTVYSSQISFTSGDAPGGSGVVFPIDDVARASSIRHIFRPGFFRMQVGLGDLGFDVDVAEAAVRSELEQEYVPLPGAKEAIEAALAETTWGVTIEEKKKAYEAAKRADKARAIAEALAGGPLLQEAVRRATIEAALANVPLLKKAIEEARAEEKRVPGTAPRTLAEMQESLRQIGEEVGLGKEIEPTKTAKQRIEEALAKVTWFRR